MKFLERRLSASVILLVLLSLTALAQQEDKTRAMHHEGIVSSVAFNADGQDSHNVSQDIQIEYNFNLY